MAKRAPHSMSAQLPTAGNAPSANGESQSLAPGWRWVKFGDVVEDVNEAERDPTSAGLERFVGLEHIDPNNLRIGSWGLLADTDVTFTKRFRAGQVLFGKRRAYQRKVAVADFDGICSSDILTFEAKGDDLLPELLPFIVQSESFFQHAVGTSSGSLSPRTRWSQIQDYTLPLPPRPEQKRNAEILAAADDVIESVADLNVALRQVSAAVFEAELDRVSGTCLPLREIWASSPESGFSPTPSPSKTGHYVLSLAALSAHGYQAGHLKPVPLTSSVMDCRLAKGDFLISRSNTVELVGLVGIFDEDRSDVSFPDLMMRIPLNTQRINARYLELVMLSKRGRTHMSRVAAGTSGSMKKINRKGLGSLEVPFPPLAEQQRIVDKMTVIASAIQRAEVERTAAQAMKTQLLQRLLFPQMEPNHVQ